MNRKFVKQGVGIMVNQGGSGLSIFDCGFPRVTHGFVALLAGSLVSIFIFGCGRGDFEIQTHSTTPTSAPGMEDKKKVYVVHISEKRTQLLRGLVSTRDLKITVDSANKKIKIVGTVTLAKGPATNNTLETTPEITDKETDIELEGTYNDQGIGTLVPATNQEPQALKVRAMVTCIDKIAGDCKRVIADLFVSDPTSKTYHFTQVQSNSSNSNASSSSGSHPSTLPGSDSEGSPDLYVGHTYTNFDKLFDDAPAAIPELAQPPALDRPTDQAIGAPDNGQLTNATDLFERITAMNAPLDLPNKSRNRFYGTFELVEFLIQMAFQSEKLALGYHIQASDLSQKTGGRLINSLHLSHQNGLDVDVGYFTSGRLPETEDFPNVVVGKSLRADFLTAETLKYFQTLFLTSNGAIDRIFINQVIKTGFCKKAKDPAFLASIDHADSLAEVLRRLRVWDGHDDHFHLRLKCTKYHPRCRQMTEPPLGDGCN